MNLAELRQKYDDLGKEIEKLKSQPNKSKLHLNKSLFSELLICYKDAVLGRISIAGHLHILNDYDKIENYKQWRLDGMPIDIDSAVEWNGGEYKINNRGVLERIDFTNGEIYDFMNCLAYCDCQDPSIERFKHNNRPVLF
jgi:hypothetical protein